MKISIKANIKALVITFFALLAHLSNAQVRCDLEDVRLSIISIDGATIDQGTSFIPDAFRNGVESNGPSLEITGLGCGLITMEVELEYFWKKGVLDNAWIHGVSFVPSSGWLSSEAGELPDGWDYYDSVTGDCSGDTYYDGYFYDECDSLDYGRARCSCSGRECDPCNSPNDNYGFNCSGNNCPKFRFSLTYCPSGNQTFDETISFNITNDGNSGSWDRASSCYYLVSYPVRINSSGTEPPDSIVWLSDLPQDIFISCQNSIPSPDSLLFGAASGCINSAYVQATVLDSLDSKNKLIYTWNVETPCGEKLFHQQSIYVQEQELQILGDPIICPSDSTQLSIDYLGISTLWNTGETSNAIMVSDSGTYSVSVTYPDGCILQDTFTLSHFPSPQAILIGDDEICENDSTSIILNELFATYLWSTDETSPSIIVGETDNYVVTVTDTNSCTASTELLVTVHPLPTINIQGENYFCEGDSTYLNLTQSYNQIIWDNGSEQSLVSISEPGIYQVTVYDNFNCSVASSIEVLELPNPSPTIIGDNQLCDGDTGTLSIQDSYESVTWNTGSTLPETSITTGGDYSITVIDSLGCEGSDTLSVELIPAPQAEIDSVYCYKHGTYAVAFTSNTSNIENSLGLDITASQGNQYIITDIDTSVMIGLVFGASDCLLELNIESPDCYCNIDLQLNDSIVLDCENRIRLIEPAIIGDTSHMQLVWTNQSGQVLSNEMALQVDQSDLYYIELSTNRCYIKDSIIVLTDTIAPIIEISALPTDTINCDIGEILLNINDQEHTSTTWTGVDQYYSDSLTVLNAGTFYVELRDTTNNCSSRDSIIVYDNTQMPSVEILESEMLSCRNDSVLLEASVSATSSLAEYTWCDIAGNTISSNHSSYTKEEGWHYFKVAHPNTSCNVIDSTFIFTNYNQPSFNLKSEYLDSCNLQEQQISVNFSDNSNNNIIQWSLPNGSISDLESIVVSEADIYHITVTDSISGCSTNDSITTSILKPISTLVSTQNSCIDPINGAIQVEEIQGGFTPFEVLLDDIRSDNNIQELEPGQYLVTIRDSIGCEKDTLVSIDYHSSINLVAATNEYNALTDEVIKPEIDLSDEVEITSISWQPNTNLDCTDCLTPNITVDSSIVYQLSVIDKNGCVDTVLIQITTPTNTALYLPNIFSPNNDGVNDALNIVSNRRILVNEVAIFNRWGNEMNSSKDIQLVAGEHTNIWDGTYKGDRVQPGVYVVYVEYLDAQGAQQYLISDVTVVY